MKFFEVPFKYHQNDLHILLSSKTYILCSKIDIVWGFRKILMLASHIFSDLGLTANFLKPWQKHSHKFQSTANFLQKKISQNSTKFQPKPKLLQISLPLVAPETVTVSNFLWFFLPIYFWPIPPKLVASKETCLVENVEWKGKWWWEVWFIDVFFWF
jgi:hypothetical protein